MEKPFNPPALIIIDWNSVIGGVSISFLEKMGIRKTDLKNLDVTALFKSVPALDVFP